LPQSVERNLLRKPPPLGSMAGHPQASLTLEIAVLKFGAPVFFSPLFSR